MKQSLLGGDGGTGGAHWKEENQEEENEGA